MGVVAVGMGTAVAAGITAVGITGVLAGDAVDLRVFARTTTCWSENIEQVHLAWEWLSKGWVRHAKELRRWQSPTTCPPPV